MSKKENFDSVSNIVIAGLAIGFPITAVVAVAAKEVVSRYLADNTEKAREILIRELQHADSCDELLKVMEKDSLIVRVARYHHAALIGAAHTNLRILARLVIHGDGTRAIAPDDFLYLAQVIESLRHDELVVLASFIRARQRRQNLDESEAGDCLWEDVRSDLSDEYSGLELGGLANALLRTGFLYADTDNSFGSGGWYVTPLLMRLETTIQFASAVKEAKQR